MVMNVILVKQTHRIHIRETVGRHRFYVTDTTLQSASREIGGARDFIRQIWLSDPGVDLGREILGELWVLYVYGR
jgi:hypothetical protein